MDSKFNILIDSNIYWSDPRREKLEFKALTKLCQNEHVQLHIPYIVEKEFCSHQLIEQSKLVKRCIKSLKKLPRQGLNEELIDETANLALETENLLHRIKQKGTSFINWADLVGAQRYPLNLAQTEQAFDAYFQGTAPLKEPKNREHIPDSFIYQCTREITQSIPELIVVVNDRGLRKAIESELNLKCYKTLTEFIDEEDVQIILREQNFIDDFPDCLKELDDYLSSETEDAVGDSIVDEGIESMSDEADATIHGYGNLDDIDFRFEEAIYYGDGLIGVPFVAIIEAYYTYYIFKADYFCMEDAPSSISDHNKHYFEADDSNFVRVEGILEFSLEYESYAKGNMNELVSDISVNEVSSVDLYAPQYLMALIEKDGIPFPLANISRKNFIKYELPAENTMRIHHRQKVPHTTNVWDTKTVTFEIEPLNKHMLRVKDW